MSNAVFGALNALKTKLIANNAKLDNAVEKISAISTPVTNSFDPASRTPRSPEVYEPHIDLKDMAVLDATLFPTYIDAWRNSKKHCAGAFYDNKIFYIGGVGNSVAYGTSANPGQQIQIYDCTLDSWSNVDLPAWLISTTNTKGVYYFGTPVHVGEWLYFAGGYDGVANISFAWKYNMSDNTFVQLGSLPVAVYGNVGIYDEITNRALFFYTVDPTGARQKSFFYIDCVNDGIFEIIYTDSIVTLYTEKQVHWMEKDGVRILSYGNNDDARFIEYSDLYDVNSVWLLNYHTQNGYNQYGVSAAGYIDQKINDYVSISMISGPAELYYFSPRINKFENGFPFIYNDVFNDTGVAYWDTDAAFRHGIFNPNDGYMYGVQSSISGKNGYLDNFGNVTGYEGQYARYRLCKYKLSGLLSKPIKIKQGQVYKPSNYNTLAWFSTVSNEGGLKDPFIDDVENMRPITNIGFFTAPSDGYIYFSCHSCASFNYYIE